MAADTDHPTEIRCSLDPCSTDWLPDGEVHIWQAGLDLAQIEIEAFYRTLSEDEIQRANRYRFECDRRRFVARRGFLRQLLSIYIAILPSDFRLIENRYGKPFLAQQDFEATGLHFNLAHSNDLALFAFARRRSVGVDLEQLRDDFDPMALAEGFFSTREKAIMRSLDEKDRRTGFFLGWTRKEAFIKALGKGLSVPLDQFDVNLTPGEPPRLLARRDEPQPCLEWTLVDIDPGPGYLASLAVEGDQPDAEHPVVIKHMTVEPGLSEGYPKSIDLAESG